MKLADQRPIVCGTDFSSGAREAADVAGAIATRLGVPILLVHGVDERGEIPARYWKQLMEDDRPRLSHEADRLRANGISVEQELAGGVPNDGVVKCAASARARMLVVASSGQGAARRWLMGSTAERIAECSPVPTLVVRNAEVLAQWVHGARVLKVFVATDFSANSHAALRWLAELRRIGPCEIVAGYVEWPPDNSGFAPPGALGQATDKPCAASALEQQLRERAAILIGGEGVRVWVRGGWGRADVPLMQMATEAQADLIVVGTHQWHGLKRLQHPSVSRGILRHAPMSVACVPTAVVDPTPERCCPEVITGEAP